MEEDISSGIVKYFNILVKYFNILVKYFNILVKYFSSEVFQ